mmetsp:Transcript_10793/g.16048  ORF Transcript_10793/g.16048 Transcript_10793/m.16048 type:complete len:167 (+) Transcript_10793:1698-2198(+)
MLYIYHIQSSTCTQANNIHFSYIPSYLFRGDWSTSQPREQQLNEVRGMKETGLFNRKRNMRRKQHKRRIDEVQHTLSSIELRSQLPQNYSRQRQSNAKSKHNLIDYRWKIQNTRTFQRRCAHANHKHDEDHKKLPPNDEPLQIVPSECETCASSRHRMGILELMFL